MFMPKLSTRLFKSEILPFLCTKFYLKVCYNGSVKKYNHDLKADVSAFFLIYVNILIVLTGKGAIMKL